MTGVDFGFNFDTIVNTNDAGQGSLRQFLLNSNALQNTSLAQSGLTAGVETSLFMIPSNADPLGRAKDPGFDAVRGVAVISPTSLLPAISDGDTAVEGTTQTARVGNTNAVLLGAGGTVGADDLALPRVAGPEVEIADASGLSIGLDLQASRAVVRGLAIYGFGTAATGGNIRLGVDATSAFTGVLIENNVLGSPAHVFSDPDGLAAGSGTVNDNVAVRGADAGTIRGNLIGYAGRLGVELLLGADDWVVRENEVRRNALDADRLDGIGIYDNCARALVAQNLIADNRVRGWIST